MTNIATWKDPPYFFKKFGKSTVNSPFSIANCEFTRYAFGSLTAFGPFLVPWAAAGATAGAVAGGLGVSEGRDIFWEMMGKGFEIDSYY